MEVIRVDLSSSTWIKKVEPWNGMENWNQKMSGSWSGILYPAHKMIGYNLGIKVDERVRMDLNLLTVEKSDSLTLVD